MRGATRGSSLALYEVFVDGLNAEVIRSMPRLVVLCVDIVRHLLRIAESIESAVRGWSASPLTPTPSCSGLLLVRHIPFSSLPIKVITFF